MISVTIRMPEGVVEDLKVDRVSRQAQYPHKPLVMARIPEIRLALLRLIDKSRVK